MSADPTGDAVVGEGGRFEGLLAFRGRARVDGELRGEVVGPGSLRVGPSARVEARVEVDELVLEGSLEGEARARRRIALASTARVRGELHAPRLAIAEGALLDGRCHAGEDHSGKDHSGDGRSEPV
jgi:cytoskeletal protein CcmA (bactofilin family)